MNAELAEMVKMAKDAGACGDHLGLVAQFNTVDDALESPRGPWWAYWYADHVINGRWLKGERAILEASEWGDRCSKAIRHGQWIEAGAIIQIWAKCACLYARDVVKGRWIKAEPIIRLSDKWSKWYDLRVIGDKKGKVK